MTISQEIENNGEVWTPTSKKAKVVVKGSGVLRYDRHIFKKLSECADLSGIIF